ncbi:MAG: M24 family metallopeptidase [Actinomycetota bacterium]
MSFEQRISDVRTSFDVNGIDALLVTNLTNVRYLSGFAGSNGQFLITSQGAYLLTDPRYEQRAGAMVRGAEVVIYSGRHSDTSWEGPPTEVLKPLLEAGKVASLGIESSTMTVEEELSLRAVVGVELVNTSGVVEDRRRTKDDAEIAAIRSAVEVADAAFNHIVGFVEVGMTESQVALELEMFMRRNGAEAISFDPIVGSGPLSAHIHHSPSDRTLGKGELILLDFGAKVDGYCSDLTRTVSMGSATSEQHEIYHVVLEAQQAGISTLAEGVNGREVDAAARKVIDEAGHGERFGHGLGHGVGLDIHEAPRMSRLSDETMRARDVVTVEPGIYVPGQGGIRIEDCVLVTESGAEVLSSAPKDVLMEL